MKAHLFFRVACLGLLWVAFSGCARTISTEMRAQARTDLTFPMILENPEAYVGSTLILGGQVIETVNRPGDTLMTVLEIPLDYREMPREEVRSRGRFIAKLRGYMDPEIYRRGTRITLAGEIIGKVIRPLGELEYAYPLIMVKELHLWRDRYVEYHVPFWDWYWYPYYGPHYGFRFHYW